MQQQITSPRRRREWCILRTSGGKTLPLAASLAAAGLDAWTPTQVSKRRKPRSKIQFEVEAPIMPTFVFARTENLQELMRLAKSPLSPHPSFSVFQFDGGVATVAEAEISALRAAEQRAHRAARKGQRHTFEIGQRVHVPEGSFTGLEGVVENGDGKFALVCFGGSFRVKIATFLLRTDEVQSAPAQKGAAALAA